MRFTAAFCSLSDFTYFRSDPQKMRKSGQIADVCSSQIVVKICGFTTKDFVGEKQHFYYSIFYWFCIVPMYNNDSVDFRHRIRLSEIRTEKVLVRLLNHTNFLKSCFFTPHHVGTCHVA